MLGRSKPGKGKAKPTDTALEPVSDTSNDAAKTALEPATSPASTPMTNVIMADLVLRGGGELLRRVVETSLLGRAVGKGKAQKVIKSGSMGQALIRTAAVRIATRSVPGAIIVGGGMLAKALYDRKKARKDEKGED